MWDLSKRRVLQVLTLFISLVLVGCIGDEGPQGPTGSIGPPGLPGNDAHVVTNSYVAGEITSALTGQPIPDAEVRVGQGLRALSTEIGLFNLKVPPGFHEVTVTADHYAPFAQDVVVFTGDVVPLLIALDPMAPVVIAEGETFAAIPGTSVVLDVEVAILDGSEMLSREWAQTSGVPLSINDRGLAKPTVTLAELAAYKAALVEHLQAPERAGVLGMDPYAIELAAAAEFEVTVHTSSGDYVATVEVHAELPFVPSPGLRNVPLSAPVLLQAAPAQGYDWSVEEAPPGGTYALTDATTRWPIFTPSTRGFYTLYEALSETRIELATGKWGGGITSVDPLGVPVMGKCTTCHSGVLATREPFDAWRTSGHAHIFSQNINNPDHHWTMSCAGCHTVGFNTAVDNGGFDDWMTKEGWTVPVGAATNYVEMLEEGSGFERTAALANVQCDNCHGPSGSSNDGPAHGSRPELRISHNAQVCGQCHGEPLRHARFQQWQRSGHSNFDLAAAQGTVEERGDGAGNCGRCHSSQGFTAWVRQRDFGKVLQGVAGDATLDELTVLGLTAASVEPIGCTTCHDSHAVGTVSGADNDAKLRVTGDVRDLPAGFSAYDVGDGALCIACHNSRRGLHNDYVADPSSFSAPHAGTQADVFLGENAYFTTPGVLSAHAFLPDTCTLCHLSLTPPPADLSYNLSGTNHTFEASLQICAGCHNGFDGSGAVNAFDNALDALHATLGEAAMIRLNGLEALWVRALDPDTGRSSSASTDDSNLLLDPRTHRLVAVSLLDLHGQISLLLEFEEPMTIAWTDGTSNSTNTFAVDLRSLRLEDDDHNDEPGKTVYRTSGNFFRAAWNAMLLGNDGSHGVHNAGWAMDVLQASLLADLSK